MPVRFSSVLLCKICHFCACWIHQAGCGKSSPRLHYIDLTMQKQLQQHFPRFSCLELFFKLKKGLAVFFLIDWPALQCLCTKRAQFVPLDLCSGFPGNLAGRCSRLPPCGILSQQIRITSKNYSTANFKLICIGRAGS